MNKPRESEISNVAKLFYKYLEEKQLTTTCQSKRILQQHLSKFKEHNRHASNIAFNDILYSLESLDLIRVSNGDKIFFKGTNEWSQFTGNQRRSAKEERERILNKLKTPENRQKLMNGNGSVMIFCWPKDLETSAGCFCCEVNGKDPFKFQIFVKNVSKHTVVLKKCLQLRDSKAFSLEDEFKCTDENGLECEMSPGVRYPINVTCKIDEEVGIYESDFFFHFETPDFNHSKFHMIRHLRCTKSNDLTHKYQPTSEYAGRPQTTWYQTSDTLYGERPSVTGDKLEIEVQLQQYDVPKDVKTAVANGVFRGHSDGLNTKEIGWKKMLDKKLQLNRYGERFSLLLYLEELQGEMNIRNYDMNSVTIEKSQGGNRFWLKVPGLAEKRPSVIRGDRLFLYKLNDAGDAYENTKYEGFVHEVQLEKVLLHLNKRFSYISGMKFNVVFTFNRHPIRVEHRAVGNLLMQSHSSILFPEEIGEFPIEEIGLRMYNAKIENNTEQVKAVTSIVCGSSKIPYIIYGPPGTGKTVTVVEAIKQVVKMTPDVHILVCAPSNSACDIVTARLLEHLDKRKVFRICAPSRDANIMSDKVKEVANYNLPNREYYFPPKKELFTYSVIVSTLITAGRLATAKFPPEHFNYVFIDEAGYAMEPEFMTAVAGILSSNGRVIMAGDPKQLGPIIYSVTAGVYGLGTSYLERVMRSQAVYKPNDENAYDSRYITKLVKNYRSHKAIFEVPNQCFYDNELEECADWYNRNMLCNWSYLPQREFPVIFHSVKGKDLRESTSPSFFNLEEASTVLNYVRSLLEARGNGVNGSHIGIISPYRKQVSRIRQMIRDGKFGTEDRIKVGSVEEFQGDERRVIIISTVRSSNAHLMIDEKFRLGFLDNPKRFNVAITRAKSLLIVVGDPDILCTDPYWHKFICYCVDNKGSLVPILIQVHLIIQMVMIQMMMILHLILF